MAYLGSTPTTQSFISGTDSFNGTGSATNFTLSRLVNSTNDIQVVVNNVVQYPPNYSVSGTTLTISPAPSAGTNNVYVRYLSTTLQSIAPSQGSSIQFGTGSAALPSISFIGDTNTGIYSPAADTIAFAEGGVESARFDSAGNFGVGTSSPDSLSNFRFIDVGSSGTNQGVVQANNGTVKVAIYANSTEGYLATRTNHNLVLQTNATTQATITTAGLFQFNSGYGSVATAYGCRAWVNFNGTGTVAIRASGNVSSITDNGTGDYTVNFTTAMADTNYAITACVAVDSSNTGSRVVNTPFNGTTATTSAFRLSTQISGSANDCAFVYLAIFR